MKPAISRYVPSANLFPGQYFDSETGLHQNYFRDYDPKTGRYVQADPVGLAGGLNLYSYVGNSPVNFVDPAGLYIGQFPPPPPGYDPNTWSSGLYPNGRFWVRDPQAGKPLVAHPEDRGHWRHWDRGGDRWPPNSKKKPPNQKRPTKCDQSETDPSGDVPEWTPNEFTNTDPFSPANIFVSPVTPFNPAFPVPSPGWVPVFSPIPAIP